MEEPIEIVITKNGLSTSSDKQVSREDILDFEEILRNTEGAELGDCFPLKHTFSDGMYVREIFIPQGQVVVGKIHKHSHPNFLLKGEVLVITENGKETITAPCSMISSAGTKRALYAKTDLIWITIHHNPDNLRDLKELEDMIIAKSYEEFDKFISSKNSIFTKTKDFLIKILRR